MPVMDGVESARRIRAFEKGTGRGDERKRVPTLD